MACRTLGLAPTKHRTTASLICDLMAAYADRLAAGQLVGWRPASHNCGTCLAICQSWRLESGTSGMRSWGPDQRSSATLSGMSLGNLSARPPTFPLQQSDHSGRLVSRARG